MEATLAVGLQVKPMSLIRHRRDKLLHVYNFPFSVCLQEGIQYLVVRVSSDAVPSRCVDLCLIPAQSSEETLASRRPASESTHFSESINLPDTEVIISNQPLHGYQEGDPLFYSASLEA